MTVGLPEYLPPLGEFPNTKAELEQLEVEEPVLRHNWLYSVVPVSEQTIDWVPDPLGGMKQQISYPLFAYLTGYCRNCSTAFSRKIGTTRDYYSETPMNIPKEGCVAPR